ncbi:hypothetical protein INT47_010102, partial [Mucor saturninus]
MTDLKNIKLHYLFFENNNSLGRGEFIRLLLQDAGVHYEYVRHTIDEWKSHKQTLLAQNICNPTLPYMTIDGKYYGKTASILRFLSHKLNKYEGSNDDEVQLLDAYTDSIMDWSTRWMDSNFDFFNEKMIKKYNEEMSPQFHKTFDTALSNTPGPFLLGEAITYPDFALYHIMEDDTHVKFDVKALPNLAAFVEAIRNRPNLKTYLATDR